MQPWRGELLLQTADTASVDVVLKVAVATTEITVAGDVTNPINTDNATLGSTLERQRIDQLPLNGRSIQTLISNTTPGLENTRAFGLMASALDVVQDGAVLANRDFGGVFARPPGLDSVEEFKVESNNSSAKMNRPGTVILTTRSGTNQLHGSAFETATSTRSRRTWPATSSAFGWVVRCISRKSMTAGTRHSSSSTTRRTALCRRRPYPRPYRPKRCETATSAVLWMELVAPPPSTIRGVLTKRSGLGSRIRAIAFRSLA
jgi:hypothetical protein